MLEKLVEKIDEMCQRIHTQTQEIQSLKARNIELENTLRQKEEQISAMMSEESNENRQIQDLLTKIQNTLDLKN